MDRIDHDDVQLEQKEVWRAWREDKQNFIPLVVLSFLMNFAVLGLVSYLITMIVGRFIPSISSQIVVTMVCGAYVSSLAGIYGSMIYWRLRRVEAHSLTVHEEVLCIGDKVRKGLTEYELRRA
jgi:hypothetical protein